MLNRILKFLDLEWKLTYVGSATSSEHDQELDSLLVGPIPVGINKFIFEADAPDLKRIPSSEILGVTVILLTCSYDGREFVRVGYYVNNEYDTEEMNVEPPARLVIERVRRNVLAEKPRVTRFAIKWYVTPLRMPGLCPTDVPCTQRDTDESAPAEYPPDQPEADVVDDDGANYGADEEEDEVDAGDEEGADGKARAQPTTNGDGDHDMDGADDTAGAAANGAVAADVKEEDEASDAGSEDLEAESSGSDEEDLDEDEGEGEGEGEAEGDEDMEMGEDGGETKAEGGGAAQGHPLGQGSGGEVMVH